MAAEKLEKRRLKKKYTKIQIDVTPNLQIKKPYAS
jgi:hypothetical protein